MKEEKMTLKQKIEIKLKKYYRMNDAWNNELLKEHSINTIDSIGNNIKNTDSIIKLLSDLLGEENAFRIAKKYLKERKEK